MRRDSVLDNPECSFKMKDKLNLKAFMIPSLSFPYSTFLKEKSESQKFQNDL
jgi:hypothetical protein